MQGSPAGFQNKVQDSCGKDQNVKRIAAVNKDVCVACGACTKVCPTAAIAVYRGCYAQVDAERCVGCGLCAKTCPASCISLNERGAKP